MNLIKSILLITFISNSLYSYDQWKNEINIYKLNNQNLSIETKKYFCEHKNKKELQKEIFLFLKEQDLNFYIKHSQTIDYLPRNLIESTLKKNQNCGNPRKNIIIGSCGNVIYSQSVKIKIYKFYSNISQILFNNYHFGTLFA